MGFRFIHTADIHLDSPLRGLSAYENAPAVRVVLQGETRLHGVLTSNPAMVRAQVLAQAQAIDSDQLWVEKVKVATSTVDSVQAGDSREALAELQAIFAEAGEDPDFLEQLQQQLQPFLNKVSDELDEEVPLLELARNKRFADMVHELSPGLLAQLSAKVL